MRKIYAYSVALHIHADSYTLFKVYTHQKYTHHLDQRLEMLF